MSDNKEPLPFGLREATPIIPGTYRDREQIKANEIKKSNQRRRLSGVRNAAIGIAGTFGFLGALAGAAATVETLTVDHTQPGPTEVHQGQTLNIQIENINGRLLPNLRETPIFYPPGDGQPYNIINYNDIKAINGIETNLTDGTTIKIENFTTYQKPLPSYLQQDADTWAVLEITEQDGDKSPAYLRFKGTEGFVSREGTGDTIHLQNDQQLPENTNKTTILNS